MPPQRRLSREEARLWTQVARTVKPLARRRGAAKEGLSPINSAPIADAPSEPASLPPGPEPGLKKTLSFASTVAAQRKRPLDAHGLDASWDKKLTRAELHPDFTLDLHGHSLDSAHARLEHGLAQAAAMGARLVLVITGLPRGAEAADRGQRRGAIRAKIMDWLELGSHAGRIAAVRPAHRRHGGAGALYVVLRRTR